MMLSPCISARVGLRALSRSSLTRTCASSSLHTSVARGMLSTSSSPIRASAPEAGCHAAVAVQVRPGSKDEQMFHWSALAAVAFAGVAVSSFTSHRPIHCEPASTSSPQLRSYAAPGGPSEPAEPQSIVNAYQLSFGAICGICAGVFIKKGLKLIAFFLGGGFVLLQYLSQQRLVSVDWKRMGARYNSAVEAGAGGPPDANARGWQNSTAARLYSRFVDFLTANFQERATLLAGLALGLRLG